MNETKLVGLLFLLNDILLDMKQLDMFVRLQKLLDGIKVQQVFLFHILTIKKEGRSTIYENEYIYDDFKKKQDWVLQTLKIAKSTSTFLIITLRGHCHNIL